MLTGGVHDDLSVVQQFEDCNLLYLIAVGLPRHHSTRAIAYFEGFVQNAPCSLFPRWGTADS